MPIALITGIGGQDGSYLSEFLLDKGYRVVGTVPDDDPVNIDRIRHLLDRIEIVRDDLLDQDRIENIFRDHRPDEVYNFAANSVLAASFQQPILATMVLAMGVTRILEAIRKVTPKARFFQASSSEIFGKPARGSAIGDDPVPPAQPVRRLESVRPPDDDDLPGKLQPVRLLRHPLQPREPETQPRVRHPEDYPAAAKIKLGLSKELRLGNLDARRDWGFAGDYVRAMWLMLQQPQPDDYVLATGETHSVRDLCEEAFSAPGARLPRVCRARKRKVSGRRRPPNWWGTPRKPSALLGWKPRSLLPGPRADDGGRGPRGAPTEMIRLTGNRSQGEAHR